MSTPQDVFDRVIVPIIDREGGYVDHPADRGGPTNWGITEATARRHGYRGDMKDLPREVALHIYAVEYWDGPNFDGVAKLSVPIAAELADTGINMGVFVAAGFLQRALNLFNNRGRLYEDLRADGRIGPKTLQALGMYLKRRGVDAEAVMVAALNCFQGERYAAIAENDVSQEDFAYGWFRTRVLEGAI